MSIKLTDMDDKIICEACKNIILIGENFVDHHTSYFPEVKVTVHRSCHGKIHSGSDYKELRPDPLEVKKFYGDGHIYSFYVRKSNINIMSEIQKIRWRDKKTLSDVIFTALTEYVEKHKDEKT